MVKYEASCMMISYLMCFQMFVYNEFGSIDFGHTVGKYNLLEISMYLITIRRSNIILNLLF